MSAEGVRQIGAIYPGTFDPVHFGHIDIIQRSAELFGTLIVGVYDRPLKTLVFPFEERIALVQRGRAPTGLRPTCGSRATTA